MSTQESGGSCETCEIHGLLQRGSLRQSGPCDFHSAVLERCDNNQLRRGTYRHCENAGWSSCVGFVHRGKTLSFLPSPCGDQGVHPKRRWHTLAASSGGACCLNPWWPLSRCG